MQNIAKFRDRYIVRRTATGTDGEDILYEYVELTEQDIETLKPLLEEEAVKLYHMWIAGRGVLIGVDRIFPEGSGNYLEFQIGEWCFWFDDNGGDPELEEIYHINQAGEADAEYVFMSPRQRAILLGP